MTTRKEQLSRLFDGPTYRGPTKDVEIDGVVFEVRPPRVAHTVSGLSSQDEPVTVQSKRDLRDLLMDCVYLKEGGKKAFDKEHMELLESASHHKGGIVNQLLGAINSLSKSAKNQDRDEVAGNS